MKAVNVRGGAVPWWRLWTRMGRRHYSRHGQRHAQTRQRAELVLLQELTRLSQLTVSDIMTPRADMAPLEATATVREAAAAMRAARGRSRPVVNRHSLDHVVGVVDDIDIAAAGASDGPLRPWVRKPLRLAPSMPALDAFYAMRRDGVRAALIHDEYGGIDGFLTLEDILEGISGALHDKHEEEEVMVTHGDDGAFIIVARSRLDDVHNASGFAATPEERAHCDTVGGLVFSLAERIPARGEVVRHASGWEFTVLEADARRIHKVRLTAPAKRAGARRRNRRSKSTERTRNGKNLPRNPH